MRPETYWCRWVSRMTQRQIARHLGTTREVIARLISGLAKHDY